MKNRIWLLCLLCLAMFLVSCSENTLLTQHSLGALYSDEAEVSENTEEENSAKATNWFRRAADRVQDKVEGGKEQLNERIQQVKEQGQDVKEMLEEKVQQIKENGEEKIASLVAMVEPKPPTLLERSLRLYVWYGFCSPYTFFLYAALITFTFVRQYNAERRFSGSILYLILLCLFILGSFYVTSNAWKHGNFWELIWQDDLFVLLFPNSVMLLICYFCVSRVLIENYEKKEDEFLEQFKKEMEANRRSKTVGTMDESSGITDGGVFDAGVTAGSIDGGINGMPEDFFGYLWLIFFLTIAILFAPALICFKFVVNYILVHRIVSSNEKNPRTD